MRPTFYRPEGLLLSDDDVSRKFMQTFVLVQGDMEVKGIKPNTPFLAQLRGCGGGELNLHVVNPKKPNAVMGVVIADKFISILALNPASGVYNFQNASVILVNRSGARQWQFGLNSGSTTIEFVGLNNIEHIDPSFEVANAIYLPEYQEIKKAFNLLSSERVIASAINNMFWFRKRPNRKGNDILLMRNTLCLGVFACGNIDAFYLQNNCGIFQKDITFILNNLKGM